MEIRLDNFKICQLTLVEARTLASSRCDNLTLRNFFFIMRRKLSFLTDSQSIFKSFNCNFYSILIYQPTHQNERGHFNPYRPGWCPNGQCLLGVVLPGTWNSAWWTGTHWIVKVERNWFLLSTNELFRRTIILQGWVLCLQF